MPLLRSQKLADFLTELCAREQSAAESLVTLFMIYDVVEENGIDDLPVLHGYVKWAHHAALSHPDKLELLERIDAAILMAEDQPTLQCEIAAQLSLGVLRDEIRRLCQRYGISVQFIESFRSWHRFAEDLMRWLSDRAIQFPSDTLTRATGKPQEIYRRMATARQRRGRVDRPVTSLNIVDRTFGQATPQRPNDFYLLIGLGPPGQQGFYDIRFNWMLPRSEFARD